MLCKIKNVGNLDPAFTANGTFRLEISPPSGILDNIQFFVRGKHTTNITTAQIEGAVNTFASMQITFPRLNVPNIIWNVLPRDLVWINALMQGQRPANLNPTASAAVHKDSFRIPLALPRHLTRFPQIWGLDTRELAGPIIVEGQYGPVTSIGTGSTAITQDTSVSICVRKRRPGITPTLVLAATQNRLGNTDDARNGPTNISTGNIQALWGLFLRQHDNSAQAAQRVDGLVTRYTIDHSQEEILADDFFSIAKRRTGEFFQFAAADLPAGINFEVFAPSGELDDMPVMVGGRRLALTHDSVEQTPDDVTNVTPAANDAVYAIPVGVQLTAAGQAAFGARLPR